MVELSIISMEGMGFEPFYKVGGSGDDHIFGGSGDDILNGGSGKDFFDCNEGIDTVLDFNSKEDTINTNCENI